MLTYTQSHTKKTFSFRCLQIHIIYYNEYSGICSYEKDSPNEFQKLDKMFTVENEEFTVFLFRCC